MIPIQILFYFFNFLSKLLVVATSQLKNSVFCISLLPFIPCWERYWICHVKIKEYFPCHENNKDIEIVTSGCHQTVGAVFSLELSMGLREFYTEPKKGRHWSLFLKAPSSKVLLTALILLLHPNIIIVYGSVGLSAVALPWPGHTPPPPLQTCLVLSLVLLIC